MSLGQIDDAVTHVGQRWRGRPVTRRVTSGTTTTRRQRPQTDRPADSYSPPNRSGQAADGNARKAEHGEYGGDGRDEAGAIFEHIGAQPWLDRLVALTV
jgi:hypothetical protein